MSSTLIFIANINLTAELKKSNLMKMNKEKIYFTKISFTCMYEGTFSSGQLHESIPVMNHSTQGCDLISSGPDSHCC